MLGIIIGIASIITIVSTIKGTNEQIKESLVGAGNNAVVVQLYQDNYPYEVQYNGVPAGVYPITEETRQELCKIDHVKGVSLFCSRNYADGVYYGNNSFSGNLYGIDEYYFDVNGYSLDHGRSFLKEDFAKAKKVCMLDTAAASALFSGEDPVGKTVEMQGDSFTIVGVVKRARSTTMQIKTPSDYYQYMNETGTIFLPLKTWPMLYSFDEPQCAALRADNTDNMTSVGQKAGELLSSSQLIGADKTLSYRGQDLMEQAKNLQELSNSSNRQLIWIASISLLVGGIGGTYAAMPELYERIFTLVRGGGILPARDIQDACCHIIYKMCSGQGNMYAMIKEILRLRGAPDIGGVRAPLYPLQPGDESIAASCAADIDAALAKFCK